MRMFTILVRHAIHLPVGTKYSLCCCVYVAHSYSLMVTPLPSIHVVTCLAFCQVFMAGIFQIADWVSTLCFGSRLLLQHIHFNIQHYMVSTPRRICLCCLAWGNSFIIQGNYSHGTENDVGVTCRAIWIAIGVLMSSILVSVIVTVFQIFICCICRYVSSRSFHSG
jgi:hypothetical protein